MKDLIYLIVAIFLSLTIDASALTASEGTSEEEISTCVWKAWFKYPKNHMTYEVGKSIYVRVDPQKYHDIEYMQLYVNGKFIRKESRYPYEWAKGMSGDNYLRNLKKGTYKLKCKFKDKCGKWHEIYCTIYVKDNGVHDGSDPNHGNCPYKAWFKYPQNGKYFNKGSDVYVKVDAQKYQYIKYMELYVNGRFVRKEMQYPYEWAKGGGNGDGHLRNLKPGEYKLKARVYDKCGQYNDYFCTFYVKGGAPEHGANTAHCKYKSWFKYPKNNGTYRYGSDVYVRVDTEKYQDIQEMHLYVNNKFVRTEKVYPYEWCKGEGNGDNYLRNLKRGTYNLKVRVKTKCGKWYEYYCKFYVR